MLPGFRFLFAAIVLSMSIMVFGLGAAALLRAAHEAFASNPSWRATPETVFAQNEATRPVLALLRVDLPAAEQSSTGYVAAVAAPAEQAAIVATTTAEPEPVAVLIPEDSSQPGTAKPETPVSAAPSQDAATPVLADATISTDQRKIAAAEQASSHADETAPVKPELAGAANSREADVAAMKIALLDDAPVANETQAPTKAAGAAPDKNSVKKRLQARRTLERRRAARRARLARQAQPQPSDLFAQPATTVRSR